MVVYLFWSEKDIDFDHCFGLKWGKAGLELGKAGLELGNGFDE